MRVVEAEGQWDGLAQVAERVFAGELELTPDLPAIGWGVHAAEDAHAKGVGSRGDRRSGGGHLQHSEATSGWESTLSPTAGRGGARLVEHLVTVCRRRRGLTGLTPPRVVTLRRDASSPSPDLGMTPRRWLPFPRLGRSRPAIVCTASATTCRSRRHRGTRGATGLSRSRFAAGEVPTVAGSSPVLEGSSDVVSEYQYYEFVALDRPLTPTEMAELRSISTRAQITPTRFFNEYHWGDLKADPAELLARYFDVHVYFANWGSRRLMFRLPKPAAHLDDLRPCVPGGPATLTVTEHHVVLDLWSETEEPEEEWFEDGQLLASLTPLRAELLRGEV